MTSGAREGGATIELGCDHDSCGPRCSRAGRRPGPAKLFVLDAPVRTGTVEVERPPDRAAAEDAGADSVPVLICLNDGWGGEDLLSVGLRWAARADRPVSAVYVLTRARPRRRDLRAADRALIRARARAEQEECGAGLMLICACDVPAGLDAATGATGGEVLLWSGEPTLARALEATRVPFVELPRAAR